ncbi:MAG TPA: hypothetical protein VJ938_14075, partial [Acidimicrobiia bacterium]|nr:hypothetical protein [Acidimicrobiia bacterium]
VAVGIEFDESQPTVDGEQIVPSRQIMWESRGGDWSLVDTSGMGDPTAVASGPAGAVVTILVEDTVSVWIREGASWREAAMVPTSDHFPELVANRVGYVLRTSSGVWFSADAREWTSVGAPFGSISAGLDSFVALGASRDGNLVSWSGDGIDWTIIGSEGEFGVEDMAWISYATATDNAVVIAGQTEGTGMFREGSEGYVAIGTRGALASSG